MPASRTSAATRKAMAQYHGLAVNLRDLETDLRWGLDESPRIPQAWRDIALRPDVPFKRAVTIRLDEDVHAFFKAMGRGYLTRMNDVLRAFMQARLAGVVAGPEEVGYQPTPLETYLAGVAELNELVMRQNVRMREGRARDSDEVEIDRRLRNLRQMEADLDLPANERIIESAVGPEDQRPARRR
jgi:BrnA antitoxin of type II toxin-antitoxin system